MENALLPAVQPDAVSEPFFAAAREGRLMVQRCRACGAMQLGSALCNACHADALEWIAASGEAVVHSFVTMHLAYHEAFKAPYLAAIVELAEGPRMPVACPGITALVIGQPVQIGFASTVNGERVPAVLVPLSGKQQPSLPIP